jgi:hypothetical protein
VLCVSVGFQVRWRIQIGGMTVEGLLLFAIAVKGHMAPVRWLVARSLLFYAACICSVGALEWVTRARFLAALQQHV